MSLEELRNQYDKALDALNKNAQVELGDELKSLFDKYPRIEEVSFKNYAPYFNDGESCTFSSRYDDLSINGKSHWYFNKSIDKPYEEGQEPGDEFVKIFSQLPDSVYENIFGNDSKVTFYRDGRVEVTSYTDHD